MSPPLVTLGTISSNLFPVKANGTNSDTPPILEQKPLENGFWIRKKRLDVPMKENTLEDWHSSKTDTFGRKKYFMIFSAWQVSKISARAIHRAWWCPILGCNEAWLCCHRIMILIRFCTKFSNGSQFIALIEMRLVGLPTFTLYIGLPIGPSFVDRAYRAVLSQRTDVSVNIKTGG